MLGNPGQSGASDSKTFTARVQRADSLATSGLPARRAWHSRKGTLVCSSMTSWPVALTGAEGGSLATFLWPRFKQALSGIGGQQHTLSQPSLLLEGPEHAQLCLLCCEDISAPAFSAPAPGRVHGLAALQPPRPSRSPCLPPP